MPDEHVYYTCKFCRKNFGDDFNKCKEHEATHEDNKCFRINMPKDASKIETVVLSISEKRSAVFGFVYQSSNEFYVYVKERSEIKAAFEKLKEEAARYHRIILERDQKLLQKVTDNLSKLTVNDDIESMKSFYC